MLLSIKNETLSFNPTTQLFEFQETASIYPNGEERNYVREVLDQILQNMARDFILRTMNRSSTFRNFMRQIRDAKETNVLIETIQNAYQERLAKTINVKMFTALNTAYGVKRTKLESAPMRETHELDGRLRTFIPAAPAISLARTIPTRELQKLAITINQLPVQHREYVRRLFKTERPDIYAKIAVGLHRMIDQAPPRTLGFYRFAFFEDRNTGTSNRPEDMSHLLTSVDKAQLWEHLKETSKLPIPAAA
jgi:hypothetical protein